MLQRVKEVQESDLRMLGSLARNIQRVLPVTQADIDAAAALGKGWVVWKVFEVSDPLDNMRGGTQLIIRQNSIQPGQNVRRVIFVAGPGGQTVVIRGTDYIALPDAIANSLSYVKAFGGTEQNGTPTPDAPINIVSNNGVLKYSANIANVNAQTALVGYYISAQGVVTADSYNWIYQDYIPVSPNTTYTLTMSQSVYYVSISEYSTASDSGFVIRKTGSTGTNTTLTITTGATTNFVRFGANLDRTVVTLGKVLAINWQLNKGNSMPYQPYVEGGLYTDGTVETINAHGTNLLDLANCTDGYYYSPTGEYEPATSARLSNFIPVKSGQAYTIFVIGGTGSVNVRVNLFDTQKNWLSQTVAISVAGTMTAIVVTAAQDGYLAFSANYVTSGSHVVWESSQVVRGSYTVQTMPEYTPYYDGGTATAEMLLKVGDYQDVQSIIDGVVTRNIGIKVLDGTEEFNSSTLIKCWTLTRSVGQGIFTDRTVYCTHFNHSTTLLPASDRQGYAFIGNSGGSYTIGFGATTRFPTQEQFKQWLADQYAAGTPVIVIYPLATPTTESVTGQPLQVTDGDNVLEITQAGMAGLELEVEYVEA